MIDVNSLFCHLMKVPIVFLFDFFLIKIVIDIAVTQTTYFYNGCAKSSNMNHFISIDLRLQSSTLLYRKDDSILRK
jgi:hypothetical protein